MPAATNIKSLSQHMADQNLDWLSGLLSGASGAKILDIAYNLYKSRRKAKNQASEAITQTVQIFNALKSINTTQCLRRAVFKAHNGGHKLDVRTHKFVSLLYEDFYAPFETDIHLIQNWRMDRPYIEMLDQVAKHRKVPLSTADMEDSGLKDLYLMKGVTYSEIYYLGEDGGNFYYITFSTPHPIQSFNVATRSEIKVCVDQVTRLLKL